jgi:hypothetical protein
LIKIEKSRQDSKWMDVIKWIHMLLSVAHISARGRIISLVKCHAELGKECFDEKEKEACHQMLNGVKIGRDSLCQKLSNKWQFVRDLFATNLHYAIVKELLKVVHMSLICKDLVHENLKMPFSAVDKMIRVKKLGPDWREKYFVNDQHTTHKTRETMLMFVYGGSLTNAHCNFVFGGLSMAQLEINYQAKKQTDIDKMFTEQVLQREENKKQSIVKRQQVKMAKERKKKDDKLLFGMSVQDLEKVYRTTKADANAGKLSLAMMREKYLGISNHSKPDFK